MPDASSDVLPITVKLGGRQRRSSPKRNPSHPFGLNGASTNITAPSAGSAFAGPPNRCSAATSNARFPGEKPFAAVTFTRICGGTNSSILIDLMPRITPSSPGVPTWMSQVPLFWSAGTESVSSHTAPSVSLTRVWQAMRRPSGSNSSISTGNGLGATRFPLRMIACTNMGSSCR